MTEHRFCLDYIKSSSSSCVRLILHEFYFSIDLYMQGYITGRDLFIGSNYFNVDYLGPMQLLLLELGTHFAVIFILH